MFKNNENVFIFKNTFLKKRLFRLPVYPTFIVILPSLKYILTIAITYCLLSLQKQYNFAGSYISITILP